MYLFHYRDVKAMAEQRRAHSLARFEATRRDVSDSFRRPRSEPDAEIFELRFPLGCEIDQMGA